MSWSWPVTRWGSEVRDIWAVRRVRAHPVSLRRVEEGPVFARIVAESAWTSSVFTISTGGIQAIEGPTPYRGPAAM